MQLDLVTNKGMVSFLNVYLPTSYRDLESHDQFCMCLGEIACSIDAIKTTSCLYGVIGDFNANCYGSTFMSELIAFCAENGLVTSDMLRLGPLSDTYTFVSAAHGSTSWLDHCLCSPSLNATVIDIPMH